MDQLLCQYVSTLQHFEALLTSTDSFADRDMVMRYLGGGIGHVRTSRPRDETTAAAPVDDSDDPTVEGDLSSPAVDLTALRHALAETNLTAYQEVEDGPDLVDDGVGIDEDEEEDWEGNEDEDEDEGELDADGDDDSP